MEAIFLKISKLDKPSTRLRKKKEMVLILYNLLENLQAEGTCLDSFYGADNILTTKP